MKRTFSTELAYVFGTVFVAWGVVLMEKADFGVSMVVAPAYLLYRWLSPAWSFVTLGMAEYCLQAVLLLAMCLLLRRFRVSYLFSFVTAVVYGFMLDAFMLHGAILPAGSAWLRATYYALGMSLFAFLYSNRTGTAIQYGWLILYLFLASVIGQFGDLAMSTIKRTVGIKDFGKILPGHGGILDRFDSFLFAAPFAVIYGNMTGCFL